MKRKELERVTEQYVRSMKRYCSRIPGSFAVEAIHDLRVAYKKLRAFIRLVQQEQGAAGLRLGKRLKKLYRAAGDVRDLQLLLQNIQDHAQERQLALPTFLAAVHQSLFHAKERLVQQIEKTDWNKTNEALTSALPLLLRDASIRQFVNEKVAAIHILQLVAGKEEDLHTARKHLKDLIYVERLFQAEWNISFPFPAWQTTAPLHEMATRLGNYNDRCITIAQLHAFNATALPDDEQQWRLHYLQSLEQCAEKEKSLLIQDIKAMHLTAV